MQIRKICDEEGKEFAHSPQVHERQSWELNWEASFRSGHKTTVAVPLLGERSLPVGLLGMRASRAGYRNRPIAAQVELPYPHFEGESLRLRDVN